MYTHKNNGPSCLSPQWLCGNSCNWSHEDMKYGYTLLYKCTKDQFYSYKNIFNIYNKYSCSMRVCFKLRIETIATQIEKPTETQCSFNKDSGGLEFLSPFS